MDDKIEHYFKLLGKRGFSIIGDYIRLLQRMEGGKHLPIKGQKTKSGINVGIIGYGKLGNDFLKSLIQYNRAKKPVLYSVQEIYVTTTKENFIDLLKSELEIGSDIKIHPILYKNETKPFDRDYSRIEELVIDSDIVVVTAGRDPKDAKLREEVIDANLPIINEIAKYSKQSKALFIIATNQVDVMTYAFASASQLPYNQVVGLTQTDTLRYKYFLHKEFNWNQDDITAFVIGPHNEHMVPVKTILYNGKDQSLLLSSKEHREKLLNIEDKVRNYGLQFREQGKKSIISPAKALLDTVLAAVSGMEIFENEVITASRFDKEYKIFVGNVCLFERHGYLFRVSDKEYDLKLGLKDKKKFEEARQKLKERIDSLISRGLIVDSIREPPLQRKLREARQNAIEELRKHHPFFTEKDLEPLLDSIVRELMSEINTTQVIQIKRGDYLEKEEITKKPLERPLKYNLRVIVGLNDSVLKTGTSGVEGEDLFLKGVRGARSVELSKDKKRVFLGGRRSIRVYDTEELKKIKEYEFISKEKADARGIKTAFNSIKDDNNVLFATHSQLGLVKVIESEYPKYGSFGNIAANLFSGHYHIGPIGGLKYNEEDNTFTLYVASGSKYNQNIYKIISSVNGFDADVLNSFKVEGLQSVIRKFKVIEGGSIGASNDLLVVSDKKLSVLVFYDKGKLLGEYHFMAKVNDFDVIASNNGIILATALECNKVELYNILPHQEHYKADIHGGSRTLDVSVNGFGNEPLYLEFLGGDKLAILTKNHILVYEPVSPEAISSNAKIVSMTEELPFFVEKSRFFDALVREI